MKNELMKTNNTGFLALQDSNLREVMSKWTDFPLLLNGSRSRPAAV